MSIIALSEEQINKLHRSRKAIPSQFYQNFEGVIYIGNKEGFLERAKDLAGVVKGKSLASTLETVSTYVFTQGVASSSWVVPHPLNKFPSVTVIDSMGTEVIGQTVFINKHLININFNAPFSGTATLN